MAKNGLDVKLSGASGGASDEFGKGIVGKPEEQKALQNKNGGIGTDETLAYGGGYFRNESAGLEDGVSARETVDPSDVEPEYNYAVDAFTGNATERKVGRVNNQSAKGKGKTFEIGEM